MKKTLLSLFALLAWATVTAQETNERFAIGLHGGEAWLSTFKGSGYYDWGYNIEVSGIIKLSNNQRVEIDLGWTDYGTDKYTTNGYLHLSAGYHWYWHIVAGLGWYVGPSANVGVWLDRYGYSGYTTSDNRFCIGIGGQVGLEYDFNIPLQLTFDARPSFNFKIPGDPFMTANWFNFGLRYRF